MMIVKYAAPDFMKVLDITGKVRFHVVTVGYFHIFLTSKRYIIQDKKRKRIVNREIWN